MKNFRKNGKNPRRNIVWFEPLQPPEKAGIDQSDISKIETGNANPALSTLMRLAEGMALRLEFVPKQMK